jgi:hypothetical protein
MPRKRVTTANVQQTILEACRRAESQGFRINAEQCGLTLKQGVYAAHDSAHPVCLPLEALLLGTPSTGVLPADIAKQLGVSWEWCDGFCAGFALRQDGDTGQAGYQDGLAFRCLYYPPGNGTSNGKTNGTP